MLGHPRQLRGGEQLVGVFVLRKRLALRLEPRVVGLVQPPGKLGARFRHDVAAHVRDERRSHDRAVLVGDVRVAHDVRQVARERPAEACEGRREDEERDAPVEVEAFDPRQDAERRVVHHAAAFRVVEALEVAAGPERPHHVGAVDAEAFGDVAGHDLVDGRRRVAVVGRLLRLELVYELLVGFALRHAASWI